MDRETRIREIVESVQEFGGQMVDYSHAGGGMGGFVALAMLGDIKIDIEKLIERECAAETARADREALAHGCSEGVIHAVIHRIGGIVEGNPTGRHNFLQRVDALVEAEARADREAAARQEAERQALDLRKLWDYWTARAVDAEAEAERDRLRAELAALRGKDQPA